MKPLSIIYWTRVCLGILTGLICGVGSSLVAGLFSSFPEGLSLAIIIYILTYYVYKLLFFAKVKKPSKIFTTGIGAYFLTWIVAWGVFFTLLNPLS
ncbi:hypothetical protein DRO69_01710 [Candidatus Bathyarchaeota archaeon]|nr:MAG: hypothetical protein DRO69_01710 [Candidatus Bathyarchaeota archaeon]